MNSKTDGGDGTGRRRVLYAAGVAVGTALAGCNDTGGGDGEDGGNETAGGNETDTGGAISGEIRLGAETSGWVGTAPASIEGTTNPTLALEADTEYTIVWENLDGVEHELILADDSGEDLAKSDSAEEEGQTVTTTFTATSEMAEYLCEYHPDSMRGDVVVE